MRQAKTIEWRHRSSKFQPAAWSAMPGWIAMSSSMTASDRRRRGRRPPPSPRQATAPGLRPWAGMAAAGPGETPAWRPAAKAKRATTSDRRHACKATSTSEAQAKASDNGLGDRRRRWELGPRAAPGATSLSCLWRLPALSSLRHRRPARRKQQRISAAQAVKVNPASLTDPGLRGWLRDCDRRRRRDCHRRQRGRLQLSDQRGTNSDESQQQS